MQITADKKGAAAITELCNLALKTGGLANLPPVTEILTCLEYPGKLKPVPTPATEIPVPKKTKKRLKTNKKKKR